MDVRHILFLLTFLLDGLLADVVLEHPAFDPFSELIGITMLFIQWYHLYRSRYPPKDEVDIKDLTNLGEQ
jgi:hypothetical protein